MQKWFGLAQDNNGNVILSPTVNVYLAGTVTPATLYSDNSYSSLANPFTGATDGSYEFYAADGRYDVVPSKSGVTFDASNSSDVLVYDVLSVLTPSQLLASQNDYAPTNGQNVRIWRLSSDANTRAITGIVAPAGNTGQRRLLLVNVGSTNVLLSNSSSSSAAGNRFSTGNSRDYVLFPSDTVEALYDTTSAVWRLPYQGLRVIDAVGNGTAVTNNNAETSIYSKTVAAGLLGTSSRIRLTVGGLVTNSIGADENWSVRVKYGGTTIANAVGQVHNGVSSSGRLFTTTIAATGATATQDGILMDEEEKTIISGAGQFYGARGTATVDSTADQTLDVTVDFFTASALLTYQRRFAILEWLP